MPHVHLPEPNSRTPRRAPANPATGRVGWSFIFLYALAYIGTILLFLSPLLAAAKRSTRQLRHRGSGGSAQ